MAWCFPLGMRREHVIIICSNSHASLAYSAHELSQLGSGRAGSRGARSERILAASQELSWSHTLSDASLTGQEFDNDYFALKTEIVI